MGFRPLSSIKARKDDLQNHTLDLNILEEVGPSPIDERVHLDEIKSKLDRTMI